MKCDGLIFDVDGTLWNTTEVVAEAWNEAIKDHSNVNVEVTGAQLKQLFGKPMNEISDVLFPMMSREERDKVSDYCHAYENEKLRHVMVELYPEVKETMEKLAQKLPLFVASNCQLGYIPLVLEKHGLESLIQDTICYGDNGLMKGENLEILAQRNHLLHPVYVGDTQGDADACRQAGMPMIWAKYGFGDVQEPEYQIQKFRDLLSMVETE